MGAFLKIDFSEWSFLEVFPARRKDNGMKRWAKKWWKEIPRKSKIPGSIN